MELITCYRIEHTDGYGMFFQKLWNDKGEVVAIRQVFGEKDFPDLWARHCRGFKNPEDEGLHVKKDNKEYFCAFKSKLAVKYWIDKNHFDRIKQLGFRVYEVHCTDYQEGKYQILYTKESIIQKIDITNEL